MTSTRHDNVWTISFDVKLILASVMILAHFYRNLVLAPRISKAPDEDSKASLQNLSLNLVKANLAIGIAVLLFTSLIARNAG